MILSNKQITKVLISLHICAGWSVPLLFANPKDKFFLCQDPDDVVSGNVIMPCIKIVLQEPLPGSSGEYQGVLDIYGQP